MMPVKFKIIEMFDNSCELFENEMQHKNIESEKRIKEIVFLEILALLMSFGSLIIAFLTFLDKRNNKKK